MRLPNSGRRSNQSSFSRSRTTSPTTMVAGGFMPRLGDQAGQRGQRAGEGFLVGPGGPAHGHGGRFGRPAARHQLAGDFREGGEPHEDHQRFGHAHAVPIDGGDGVAGDEGHGGGVLAMGQRHAGISGDAQRRGDAGHDLEGDAGGGERFGLFAAAAEDERVAAFQTDHVRARAGRAR